MSNHEQPTPSHPKSDVRNTTGKNKQTPQDSVRTTSAVDLEEFCEKHYEKLLPIMADKYEYEKRCDDPEQLEAQAKSITARLAAARAAIEAQAAAAAWIDATTGEEEASTVLVSKIQVEDPNPASAASSGENYMSILKYGSKKAMSLSSSPVILVLNGFCVFHRNRQAQEML
ncbi:hypothetical protein Tco_0038771 [Tanacetum coccineum]